MGFRRARFTDLCRERRGVLAGDVQGRAEETRD
jgi:hypothetical protein